MGCMTSPRCGKGTREEMPLPNNNIQLQWADPNVILKNARICPICESRMKVRFRPIPHYRCFANGHLWRVR